MKNLVLFLMAGAMMFSCTKNESGEPKGKMTFNITADGNFITKANEINSYEAVQTVDHVMLYIYKFDGSEYVVTGTPRHIEQWRRGETWVNYTMEGADALDEGMYKFVVVGQYKDGCYSVDAGGRFGDMVSKIQTGLSDAQEIFCGYSDEVEITTGGGRAAVQMKRKVGGLLAYFKNVPEVINSQTVAFLRVKASRVTYVFNPFSGTQIDVGGEQNVVDMDLRGQKVVGGKYVGNDLSGNGVVKMDFSQLAGTYLLPCGDMDMVVQLADENGSVIKEWRVVNEKGSKGFDILPNHLYALGTKKEKGNTGGDSPIDLMQNQVLSITIDANWESIHDLNIIN